MNFIIEKKKEFRHYIKTLKNQQNRESLISASEKIIQNLQSLDCFKKANSVLSYWSMDDEVGTHNFNLSFVNEKKIYLPSIQGDMLLIKRFTGLSDLVPIGKYQIPEPIGAPLEDINSIDLIIVPGVAFDRQLNRLGRGKGYYDKLLNDNQITKVGICFDFQLFNTIPYNLDDVKMTKIVSASEII